MNTRSGSGQGQEALMTKRCESFVRRPRDFYKAFRESVPLHDYNKMYKDWWQLARKGAKGRVKQVSETRFMVNFGGRRRTNLHRFDTQKSTCGSLGH